MWVLWRQCTRGNISLRRFFLLVTAFMMTIFVVNTAFSPRVNAADAVRDENGNSVSYENNTYSRIDKNALKTGAKTKDLPVNSAADYDGFSYEANNKLYLIITTGDAATATTAKAVTYELKNGIYDPSTQSAQTDITFTTATNATSEEGKSCVVDSIGWLVCPVTTFIATNMDNVMDLLTNFLTVRALQMNTDNNPIFEIWEKVRDFSNICFIIAFLVVVYSQITNFGLSNYGLKAMLPRLIVAAILVNISYWLVGLAVDVSNLLGANLHETFVSIRKGLTGYDQLGDDLSWAKVAGATLTGVGLPIAAVIVNGGIATSLTLLIPVLVGVILAGVVALVILAARQALITLCIIISPLAFVAYVLPSTQKYFEKWKDLFLTMLLMFPIISLVIGAAQLAGYAIIANAGNSMIQVIIGLAVQVAPLAITPFIIRLSGNILGKIAGIVNNPSRGLVDRTRNWAQERAKYQAAKTRAGAPLFKNTNGRFGKLKKTANKVQRNNGINNALRHSHKTGQRQRALTAAYESMAENNATKWDDKKYGKYSARNISGHEAARKSEIDNSFYGSRHGQELERRTRSATIRKTELDNRFDRNNHDLTARQQNAEIDKTRVQTEFSNTTVGQEVDIARRKVERSKQITEQNLENNWHTLNLRDASSQAQEMTLRVRTDAAAAKKAQVESIYEDLKSNKSGAIVGSRLEVSLENQVKQQAFDAAQIISASASRKAEATRVLNNELNDALLNNGKVYQTDTAGNIVQDTAGNPIVVHQKLIDGTTELQTYATGVGSKKMMLAREAAKQEKEEETESDAAFVLMKHFNLSSNDYDALATNQNATVTRSRGGNTMTFNFSDSDAKIAAISWIAKNGSYGQREKLMFSGARGAPNESLSGFISRQLVAGGFNKMAPWANDISIDMIGQGRIESRDDMLFHTFREIIEGRIKSEGLAGSNDRAISYIHEVFQDRVAGGDNWDKFVDTYKDFMRETGKTDAEIAQFESHALEMFDARYGDLIESHDEIETSENLSKLASGQALNQIRRGVSEYGLSDEGRREIMHRRQLREARQRIRTGMGTADDQRLIDRENRRYKP